MDLGSVIRNACAAKTAQNVAIEMDVSSTVFGVGHVDQLEHVIGHLVQNALDATADGGRVSVRLDRDESTAVIEVVDSGVGMAPEFVRDRLFKPFQTTKASGMGVGVYESARVTVSADASGDGT